jgi:hypothetical protein
MRLVILLHLAAVLVAAGRPMTAGLRLAAVPAVARRPTAVGLQAAGFLVVVVGLRLVDWLTVAQWLMIAGRRSAV